MKYTIFTQFVPCFFSPWDYARVLANTPYFGYDDKNRYVN